VKLINKWSLINSIPKCLLRGILWKSDNLQFRMSIIKPNVHVIFRQLVFLSPCHFQSTLVLNTREFLSPEGGHMALHGKGAELLLSPEVERCVKGGFPL
jgi:hypothetical protein